MKTINIYKAQGLRQDSPAIEGATIVIDRAIPWYHDDIPSLAEMKQIYAKEGMELADALFGALPGGTIDALIAEMLRRRASLFVVPFDVPKNP